MIGLKELAEQAGMYYRQFEDEFCKAGTDGVPMEMLEIFAKLVAAKERNEILKMCEPPEHSHQFVHTFKKLIAARGDV